jgi:hypothetical protein
MSFFFGFLVGMGVLGLALWVQSHYQEKSHHKVQRLYQSLREDFSMIDSCFHTAKSILVMYLEDFKDKYYRSVKKSQEIGDGKFEVEFYHPNGEKYVYLYSLIDNRGITVLNEKEEDVTNQILPYMNHTSETVHPKHLGHERIRIFDLEGTELELKE